MIDSLKDSVGSITGMISGPESSICIELCRAAISGSEYGKKKINFLSFPAYLPSLRYIWLVFQTWLKVIQHLCREVCVGGLPVGGLAPLLLLSCIPSPNGRGMPPLEALGWDLVNVVVKLLLASRLFCSLLFHLFW